MYWFDMWNAVLGIRVKIGVDICVEIEIRWATLISICKNERRDQLDLESRTKTASSTDEQKVKQETSKSNF